MNSKPARFNGARVVGAPIAAAHTPSPWYARRIVERDPTNIHAHDAPAPDSPAVPGDGHANEPPAGGHGARFVWPPRRIDVERADDDFLAQAKRVARQEARAIHAPDSTVEAHPESVGAIFGDDAQAIDASCVDLAPHSNPNAPAPEAPRDVSVLANPGHTHVAVHVPAPAPDSWNAFEHAWLGVTSEPWSRRRAIVAFDAPHAACWRCASPVGLHEAGAQGCATCRDVKLPWSRLVRVGAYDGALRDAIREVKFKRFATLGLDVGRELAVPLADAIRQASTPGPIILVPVAMPLLRRLRRGVDHSKAIAVGASRELRRLGVDARVAHLLSRRHRPSQLEVAPSERYRNAAGSFIAPWHLGAWAWWQQRLLRRTPRIGPLGPSFRGTVIVIDDVRTTGATMAAACREMRRLTRRAGCGKTPIWGGVVAVATHRGLELEA